jgi:hypothetical protein
VFGERAISSGPSSYRAYYGLRTRRGAGTPHRPVVNASRGEKADASSIAGVKSEGTHLSLLILCYYFEQSIEQRGIVLRSQWMCHTGVRSRRLEMQRRRMNKK